MKRCSVCNSFIWSTIYGYSVPESGGNIIPICRRCAESVARMEGWVLP